MDGIIGEENAVRIIDAYVDRLDLADLDFRIPGLSKGRPPYAPAVLLKIYIYGYLNRIRTIRRLEKECQKNLELIWLTEQLAPDFKTIADFRKDNRAGLRNIFKAFLKFCKELELIEYRLVAIDGTKMRAQNSHQRTYRRKTIAKIEQRSTRRSRSTWKPWIKTIARSKMSTSY